MVYQPWLCDTTTMSDSLCPNSFDEIREEHARFKAAGERLAAALSRISYLCGPPNAMGVSEYDVCPDEAVVVDRVERLCAALAEAECRALKAEAAHEANEALVRYFVTQINRLMPGGSGAGVPRERP